MALSRLSLNEMLAGLQDGAVTTEFGSNRADRQRRFGATTTTAAATCK